MLRTIQVWKVNISIRSNETKVIFTSFLLPSELWGKTLHYPSQTANTLLSRQITTLMKTFAVEQ